MGRLAFLVLAVVTVLSLTGCGSSHRRGSSTYSANRVASAFTKHGLALHSAPGACGDGYVCLDNADASVWVYVFVGHTSGELGYVVGSNERQTTTANVTVVWDRQRRRQVGAALQSLR